MKILIFLTTILSAKVSGNPDPWNRLHYKSRNELNECLENTDLRIKLHVFDNTSRLENYIIKKLLLEFDYKTVDAEYVDHISSRFAREAQITFSLSNAQLSPVASHIFEALIKCSDISNFEGRLPDFDTELPEFATLLNFILVDSRYLIARTDGLRTLFSYVQNALIHLERSRSLLDNSQELLEVLVTMFYTRSEQFLDFENEVPYIKHTYSLDRSAPYTNDDPRLFVTRRLTYVRHRRPWFSSAHFLRVVSFRQSDQNISRLVSAADYYYEMHENQFFRTIFFFLELVKRNFANLNLDNTLRIQDVPDDLIQIMRNDTAFIQYLEVRYNVENSYASGRIFGQDGQIDLIEVALAFWHRLMVYVPYMTTTTDRNFARMEQDQHPNNQNQLIFPEHTPLIVKVLGGFLCSFAGGTFNTNEGCSSNPNQFLVSENQTRVFDGFLNLFKNETCDRSRVSF